MLIDSAERSRVMRWQLLGPWPHGAVCIPAGTEIIAEPDGTASYNHMRLTLPMPIDAKAMDDEAAALMRSWYPDQHYRLLYGPDVGAVKTAAAPPKRRI
jgi:hypothetical protein